MSDELRCGNEVLGDVWLREPSIEFVEFGRRPTGAVGDVDISPYSVNIDEGLVGDNFYWSNISELNFFIGIFPLKSIKI